MKSVLIAAVICLGTALWLIFNFCHGNVGLGLSDSLANAKLNIDVTTTGLPVIIGAPLLALGLILLIVAFLAALIGLFRREKEVTVKTVPERREIPFEG